MVKAIGLISGGLDSILATKMISEQGIEVIGVCFTSPFFDNSKYSKSLTDKLGIELKIINLDTDYINMIKKPKYGYGKNFNPCIDCHAFMLKQAKNLMEELNADFIFTGEVLNERPMSQNKQALNNIEREAGLKGLLLRPLSAQLLEPTIPEIQGLIDRNKLGKISGRSRKPQLELAKKYTITDFHQPAGGCLLTEPNFSKRLKDALEHNEASLNDLELLKIGRHFRLLDDKSKIIVGRDESENNRLVGLSEKSDLILQPVENKGPIVLVRHYQNDPNIISIAAGLCARYSDKGGNNLVKIKFNDIIIEAVPLTEGLINEIRI